MFERLLELYKRNGCTIEQLERYANLGKITRIELREILAIAAEGDENAKHK